VIENNVKTRTRTKAQIVDVMVELLERGARLEFKRVSSDLVEATVFHPAIDHAHMPWATGPDLLEDLRAVIFRIKDQTEGE